MKFLTFENSKSLSERSHTSTQSIRATVSEQKDKERQKRAEQVGMDMKASHRREARMASGRTTDWPAVSLVG